ncbi:MAG: hypothetical protein ABR609_01460 [Acidimicrobiia bacterium]
MGAALAAAYVILVIGTSDWNPTVMLAQGVEAETQLEYAERVLDLPVETRPELGHDGKFFFILANDPLLIDPEDHAAYLDRPTFRAQRILYPLLAGGFGLFSAIVTMWGMVVVNVVAVGFGSLATAGVARLLGANPWLGLVFAISPGIIAELDINGGGVVALALALAGLWLLVQGREPWAIGALTGAVLARETMVLFVAALFLWWWMKRGSFSPALLGVPALTAIGWRVYASVRLSPLPANARTPQGPSLSFDLLPLRGAFEASAQWAQRESRLIWVLCLVLLLLLFARRAWRSPAGIAWSAWPFALMSTLLSVLVWLEPYDLARATAPVFIAYPLLLFARVPIEGSKVR